MHKLWSAIYTQLSCGRRQRDENRPGTKRATTSLPQKATAEVPVHHLCQLSIAKYQKKGKAGKIH